MLTNPNYRVDLHRAFNILHCGLCDSIKLEGHNIHFTISGDMVIRNDGFPSMTKKYVLSNCIREWWNIYGFRSKEATNVS